MVASEPLIAAQLQGALFGSLIHVTSVTARALAAPLAMIRVFGMESAAPRHYLYATGIGGLSAGAAELEAWAAGDQSPLQWAADQGRHDEVFRLEALLASAPGGAASLFGPVVKVAAVQDAVGAAFDVQEPVWACLMLVRVAEGDRFSEADLARLDQWRPLLARTLRQAYLQELGRAGDPSPPAADRSAARLAKLTDTEERILAYLCQRLTEKEVASRLGRSAHTVHVHVKNIYRKLEVNSRRELLQFCAALPSGTIHSP